MLGPFEVNACAKMNKKMYGSKLLRTGARVPYANKKNNNNRYCYGNNRRRRHRRRSRQTK